MNRFPWLTVGLTLLTAAFMLLPLDLQQALYFDYASVQSGNLISAISGHWIHADWEHLCWNFVALGVLGIIIEKRSRVLLVSGLLAGMMSVDLLLLSSFSDLAYYCGLSGLLNTLLGLALWLHWKETGSRLVLVGAILSIGKIVVETYSGNAIFTHFSWPPFAQAHIAGLLGTPLAIVLYQFWLAKMAPAIKIYRLALSKRVSIYGDMVDGKRVSGANT